MDLHKLISVLITQEKNLKTLLKIGLDKQDILIKNDFAKLNEIITHEEQALLNIQLTEENRLSIMQKLFIDYNINNERYKLGILVENLKGKADNKITEEISHYEKRIKNTIESINRINHLNMALIQQSRSLINETVKAVINVGTKTILDRKG